jgi:hypothetical protein
MICLFRLRQVPTGFYRCCSLMTRSVRTRTPDYFNPVSTFSPLAMALLLPPIVWLRQILVLRTRAKHSAFLKLCPYMKTAPVCQDNGKKKCKKQLYN